VSHLPRCALGIVVTDSGRANTLVVGIVVIGQRTSADLNLCNALCFKALQQLKLLVMPSNTTPLNSMPSNRMPSNKTLLSNLTPPDHPLSKVLLLI